MFLIDYSTDSYKADQMESKARGSGTQTITEKKTTNNNTTVGTIRVNQAPRRRVTWTEDTVDNEHMNKRKSNICCIWHASQDTIDKGIVSDE